MRTLQWVVLLLWLWPEPGGETKHPAPYSALPARASLSATWHARLEVAMLEEGEGALRSEARASMGQRVDNAR
jgi:hypothetical protein